MNLSGLSAVSILVLLIGVANGAALQKRWIPERMSDNDYGFDNQQHQTTGDDLTAYQPNYMNYWSDYYPGGYSGGDYSGMMYRAGGQAPAPGQVMMDPVQQLQYVQAYSYAQQLQQQYPNGVPLPYRPQPSPYQPYQLSSYQPYQPGADATGRALLNLNALTQHKTLASPNAIAFQNGQLMHPAHLTPVSQKKLMLVEAEPQETPAVFEVMEDPSSSFPTFVQVSDFQTEDASTSDITNIQEMVLEKLLVDELNREIEVENEGEALLPEEDVLLTDAEFKEIAEAIAEDTQEHTHSHDQVKQTESHSEKEIKEQKMLLEALEAKIEEAKLTQDTKKISKSHFLKGRAHGPGGSGDYIDPNMYANYGGNSGLVDMASPLDLVYPGAMVPAQSYPPVSPTYYPYAPPNPYSIPQQVYQPSAYSQATSGPYGAPVPYPSYPTMPSYYNAPPPLRYARNSAAALPTPFVVKYVYGAVPMKLPQSG